MFFNQDIGAPTRSSYLDPMRLSDIRKRDIFPKRGLSKKYIGDRYPLCEDLPEKHFLRIGAKYKLLGGNAEPKWQRHQGIEWNDPSTKHFSLDTSSELYNKLNCQTDVNGECTYEAIVVLDQNLACLGKECNVDTVRVVQVNSIFYEYVRVPCVVFDFYEDAKKLTAGWSKYKNSTRVGLNAKHESYIFLFHH